MLTVLDILICSIVFSVMSPTNILRSKFWWCDWEMSNLWAVAVQHVLWGPHRMHPIRIRSNPHIQAVPVDIHRSSQCGFGFRLVVRSTRCRKICILSPMYNHLWMRGLQSSRLGRVAPIWPFSVILRTHFLGRTYFWYSFIINWGSFSPWGEWDLNRLLTTCLYGSWSLARL